MLDPNRFVERGEVLAVDAGRDCEQGRMRVVAKAGFRVLKRAEQHLHHPLWRPGRRLGLRHPDLVPAVALVGAAERIRQGRTSLKVLPSQSAPSARLP